MDAPVPLAKNFPLNIFRFSTTGLRILFLTVLGVGLVGARVQGAGETDPERAVQAFYDILRNQKVDGLPKGKALDELAPRMTPELAGLIREAVRVQAELQKTHPDEKPPWIEGDLFGSLFEGATRHAVGNAVTNGDRAEVPVAMEFTAETETVRWTDTVLLRRSGEQWLVDDVRYGGDWPFAARGTLTEALRAEES